MTNGVKERLKELGLKPSKRLGQHFLVNSSIAARQVDEASITSDDVVLEIGPGLGILTEEIVQRAKKTIVVEKERAFKGYLEGRFKEFDFRVIQGDFLEVDVPKFDKVVSNIPFNISSPLTFKLLEHDFKTGVLMYQKEFADRMVAEVGGSDYSRLSVMVSTKARVKKLFDVSRNNFFPPPRVDASVVYIEPGRSEYDITYEDIYSDVVRELFNYRRKTIKNALKYGFGLDIKTDFPFRNQRVEKLSPVEINRLVETLVDDGYLGT